MKRFLSISLLLLFIFNLFGLMIGFNMLRHEWRLSVWATLTDMDKNHQTVFHFSKKDIDIDEKEIVHEGQYYDIIAIENCGNDSLKVYCFEDKKEQELVQQYHHIIFQKTSQDNDFQGKTHFYLDNLLEKYIFKNQFFLSYNYIFFIKNSKRFNYKKYGQNAYLSLPSPPPKSVLS